MTSENFHSHLNHVAPLIEAAGGHYHKLVLVGGGCWQQRTSLLRGVCEQRGMRYVTLGQQISQALMDLPPGEHPLEIGNLVSTAVSTIPTQGTALDHIEILFGPDLQTDPFRLLTLLSREQVILVSWPGSYDGHRLSYAEPVHPEYFTNTASQLLYYSLEESYEIS
jgi:hypothetical protein